MRKAAILANLVVALYLSSMGVAQMLGRDTGSNAIPTALVVMIVILRVLTESRVTN
jgi:hypothetical protein